MCGKGGGGRGFVLLEMAVSQTLRAKLLTKAKQEGVHMNALVTTYLAEGLAKHDARI